MYLLDSLIESTTGVSAGRHGGQQAGERIHLERSPHYDDQVRLRDVEEVLHESRWQ